MATPTRQHLARLAPPMACLALLAGVVIDSTLFHSPTPQTESYHAAVSAAAASMPARVGEWVASEIEVPRAAQALLRPNVIFSRRYHDFAGGRAADFLLVQCRDATDMIGHFPPVCYPGSGWTQVAARPVEWRLAGEEVVGTEYEFVSHTFSRSAHIVVCNVMVLPDGRFARDMRGVNSIGRDYRKKYYGAAQVQVVFDADVPPAERAQIVETLLAAHQPVLDQIRSGVES